MNISNYKFNKETNKYVCPECGKEYSKKGIGNHFWRKHTEEGRNFDPNRGYKEGTRHAWNKGLTAETTERACKCAYCGKEFSKYGIKAHIWRMHTKEGKKFNPLKNYIKGSRHAWNKGLTTEISEKVRKCSETLRKNYRNGITKFKPHPQSDETRKKLSEIAKQRYLNGWDNKAGRAPKYKYTKKDGRVVTLDGSWELKVAKYFDNIGIEWERNTKRFPYINLKGKDATYCPDFYLPSKDLYIEVKGYTTDLDKCKWSQFTKKLEVWTKKELLQFGILQ